MSLCVKTGAKVFIYDLGIMAPADIYAVGPETLIIRWNLAGARDVGPIKARELGATHFVQEGPRQDDDWCRDDLGVLVTQRRFVEGDLCE